MAYETELQVMVYGGEYQWVRTSHIHEPRDSEQEYVTTGLGLAVEPFHPKTFVYNPLQQSALFRTFADSEPSRDGVLQFANRFGLLSSGSEAEEGGFGHLILLPDAPGAQRGTWEPVGYGESLSRWQEEIRAMKEAVDLWLCVRGRCVKTLEQRFEWDTQSAVPALLYRSVWWNKKAPQKTYTVEGSSMSARSVGGAWVGGFQVRPGDVLAPALVRIHELTNERLLRSLTPVFVWPGLGEKAEFRYHVSNLLTALWFQFAQAVIGNKLYRTCSDCGNWMETPTIERNPDRRRFCSNACRQRAYRRRRASPR